MSRGILFLFQVRTSVDRNPDFGILIQVRKSLITCDVFCSGFQVRISLKSHVTCVFWNKNLFQVMDFTRHMRSILFFFQVRISLVTCRGILFLLQVRISLATCGILFLFQVRISLVRTCHDM